MIPSGPDAIRNLVARIGMDLIPKAGDAYTATDLVYFTVLLGMVAQDYDRAAEVLVAEHAALAPIFREAAAHLGDAALKTRIADALAMEAPSLQGARPERSLGRSAQALDRRAGGGRGRRGRRR